MSPRRTGRARGGGSWAARPGGGGGSRPSARDGSRSHLPHDEQVQGPAELPAPELDATLVVEPEPGEALAQDPEGRPRLGPGQPGPDAEVAPRGEGEVGSLPPVDVEAVGVRPAALVAVGGGD